MAVNPDVFAVRREYHRRLVDDGDFDPRVPELASLAVSLANDCPYCVASHSETLIERVGLPEEAVDALARGDLAAFDDRERAVVEFAEQVAREPAAVDETHLTALREVGFDDPGIIRLLTIVAAAVAANTIADALSLHPSDREDGFAGYDGG